MDDHATGHAPRAQENYERHETHERWRRRTATGIRRRIGSRFCSGCGGRRWGYAFRFRATSNCSQRSNDGVRTVSALHHVKKVAALPFHPPSPRWLWRTRVACCRLKVRRRGPGLSHAKRSSATGGELRQVRQGEMVAEPEVHNRRAQSKQRSEGKRVAGADRSARSAHAGSRRRPAETKLLTAA